MHFNKFAVALALPLFMVLGCTASAARFLTITYTGTYTDLDDPNGYFGAPVTHGTGTFTDIFVFDLTKGHIAGRNPGQDLVRTSVSTVVRSTVTINGISKDFDGSGVELAPDHFHILPDVEYLRWQVTTRADKNEPSSLNLWSQNLVIFSSTAVPYQLSQPFSASGTGKGIFWICELGTTPHCPERVAGLLKPTSIVATLSDTLPVPTAPEPSAWLLLIAGFGTIGMALRRRAVPVAA